MHIVSLIASATETICALGAEDQLVGRSHECDFPPSVTRLPVCTEPKFDVSGSSADIDRRVKEVLHDSLSVYRVHTDVLERLRPDLIVTQAHCEVCAVSLRDVERAVAELVSSKPKVVSLNPNALADVWAGMRQVAEALGDRGCGDELVDSLQERMREVSEKANSWGRRPSVAFVEWIDPLMAGGNWMPELIELAGGVNLFGVAGTHSPWLTWDELVGEDPDVIVVAPCGFDLPRTRTEMATLTAKPEWKQLRAVRNGRVWVGDGNAYFNRPGPRLVESMEMLAEAIQPGAFCFGHEGFEMFAP